MVWSRAIVLGGAGLASAVLSHVAGGGLLPGPVGLLSLLLLAVAVSSHALRVRRSAWSLLAWVVAVQTGGHLALTVLAGHATPEVPTHPHPGGTDGLLHDHPGEALSGGVSGVAGDAGLSHLTDHLAAQGPAMVIAHVLGAAALGLLLAVGETAWWALVHLVEARRCASHLRWSGAVARGAAVLGLTARRATACPPEPRALPPCPVLARPVLSRRGPPLLLAA